jgi:hypothetical protein
MYDLILWLILPLKNSNILLTSNIGYFHYCFNDYNEVFDTVLEPFNRYAHVGSPRQPYAFIAIVTKSLEDTVCDYANSRDGRKFFT